MKIHSFVLTLLYSYKIYVIKICSFFPYTFITCSLSYYDTMTRYYTTTPPPPSYFISNNNLLIYIIIHTNVIIASLSSSSHFREWSRVKSTFHVQVHDAHLTARLTKVEDASPWIRLEAPLCLTPICEVMVESSTNLGK